MQYIKEIDIHGYTQQEARKMIDAALKKPDALTLRIIHGYNQGQISQSSSRTKNRIIYESRYYRYYY